MQKDDTQGCTRPDCGSRETGDQNLNDAASTVRPGGGRGLGRGGGVGRRDGSGGGKGRGGGGCGGRRK